MQISVSQLVNWQSLVSSLMRIRTNELPTQHKSDRIAPSAMHPSPGRLCACRGEAAVPVSHYLNLSHWPSFGASGWDIISFKVGLQMVSHRACGSLAARMKDQSKRSPVVVHAGICAVARARSAARGHGRHHPPRQRLSLAPGNSDGSSADRFVD